MFDAPGCTWVHWIVYNLPPSAENLSTGEALPEGARQGLNSWGRQTYGGPCPPSGRHRYSHRLYALDIVLPDVANVTKPKLEAAMKGHVLAKGETIGTFARQ